MTRLELAASTTPKWRATSCATPRNPPCFPQSHYIIALDFQNVNRFVKNCCTTFSKIYFSFVAFSQNRRGGQVCGNFLRLTGSPPPPFLFVCFLFCLPAAVLPAHLSRPAVSTPLNCPPFPFTLPLSRRPRPSHNAAPRQIATKCE